MKRMSRVALVGMASLILALTVYAQDEGKTDVKRLSERLRQNDLLGLIQFVAEDETSFPKISSDEFYRKEKAQQRSESVVALGKDMLKKLPNLRNECRKVGAREFATHISRLIEASHKIVQAGGYRNIVLGVALDGTVGQLLLERVVLEEGDVEQLSKLARKHSGLTVSPKEFIGMLEREFSAEFQIPEGVKEREAFFSVVRNFLGPKAKTNEDVRGHLAFESNYDLFHNYDSADVAPLVGVILRVDYEADIIAGLLEMKATDQGLPEKREQFLDLCEKSTSAVTNHSSSPLSGKPYRAKEFWKVANFTRKTKEWRTCFREHK